MLKFGIIGAGRIATVHARSINNHPDTKLIMISDPIETAAKSLALKYGIKYSLNSDDIFNNKDIDAVIICSPTDLHIEHIVKAAKAGKAILCEKPVTLDSKKLAELDAGIKNLEPTIMMGFNRRFDPTFNKIHHMIAEDEKFTLEQLTIISRDPAAPPKEYLARSGGIFRDMTIHDFDMARFFLGKIVEVTAIGQHLDPALLDTSDFDGAVVTLKSDTGAVATIINSRHCATGYDQRIEVFGTKGSISADNLHGTTIKISTDKIANAEEPYLNFFLERYEAAYFNELNSFIDAINNNRTPSPSIIDGIEALKIADAAAESAKTGKTVEL